MSTDLLLDTHALIWLVKGEPQARGLLELVRDDASTVTVSAASWMEIAIKRSIGKLDVEVAPTRAALRRVGALDLALTGNHAEQLEQLPRHHADPFDRMLIAQALSEGMTIATVDPVFARYEGLSVIWP